MCVTWFGLEHTEEPLMGFERPFFNALRASVIGKIVLIEIFDRGGFRTE